jgi:hypothetical protein
VVGQEDSLSPKVLAWLAAVSVGAVGLDRDSIVVTESIAVRPLPDPTTALSTSLRNNLPLRSLEGTGQEPARFRIPEPTLPNEDQLAPMAAANHPATAQEKSVVVAFFSALAHLRGFAFLALFVARASHSVIPTY